MYTIFSSLRISLTARKRFVYKVYVEATRLLQRTYISYNVLLRLSLYVRIWM